MKDVNLKNFIKLAVTTNICVSKLWSLKHNLGQNSIDNLVKLSVIGFSMECFTADFSQFSDTTVKICVYGGLLGTHHQFQVFQEFSKIS